MFENHRKSLIQNCERSELHLHFEWTKVHYKGKNGQFWRVFENLKFAVKKCYQTGQFWLDKNWWKMPKLKNSNATYWVILKHCVSKTLKVETLRLKEAKESSWFCRPCPKSRVSCSSFRRSYEADKQSNEKTIMRLLGNFFPILFLLWRNEPSRIKFILA